MASLDALLKSEITRLARKAAREHLDPVRSVTSSQRKQIAALKRQVAQLEKKVKRLGSGSRRSAREEPGTDEAGSAPRFQARGLRSLRAKLGLSAHDFGRLVGVSGQSIYHWEQEKSQPRKAQVASLAAIRLIGKREAMKRLRAMESAETAA